MDRQRIDCLGQGKNHVKIRHRQKFCFSFNYPILLILALTLRTMPIAARVVTYGKSSTTIASINMTAQLGCSAFSDGRKRAKLPSV
jgi:hypothetical protein